MCDNICDIISFQVGYAVRGDKNLTALLIKIFINDNKQADSPAVREKCGMISGICGIILNTLLSILKFLIGGITNSIAITADALNNLTDCLTSLLTILGFRWSAKPADREHPFGHARIEYLISLAIAGIILVTGYEVMRSSISMIINPEPLNFTLWAVAVIVFSMIVKYWMSRLNRKLGNLVNSDTLIAVSVDSRNDVLINITTLIALLFTLISDYVIDGYIGALIALVFLRSGYKVAKEALSRIVGNPAERDVASDIKKIIKSHKGVLGIHDLVVHSYGPGRNMASLHIEVPMDMSLADSNSIVKKIRHESSEQLGIPVIIQLDPIDLSDERLRNISNLAQSIVEKDYAFLHPNEFRIIDAPPKPIIVFDLEFPLAITRDKALSIRDSVADSVRRYIPGYDCCINIEYSYSE